jgi:hypothetical protein
VQVDRVFAGDHILDGAAALALAFAAGFGRHRV